ncbi:MULTISPECIES: helix-turn-helix transcriptional regulator [Vibrio]|uniref:DNA-binding protein n=2 Tax=Vibrio TaxID=662 RepID=A0A7X4LJV6_9VIBR|nr:MULTISPECIES: PAS domain-containing protein [Vibrio]MBF9002863.1 PAS domain-containing protein [Vibrio nitrifigilis]MZI92896.1 hypothetical protein [Vibrio eleionomae]
MNNQLELFKRIAAFLAQQMQNCEFVVHDLSNLEHSITYIGNGHISGREIGDSATDLVLKVLRNKDHLTRDYTQIYNSAAENNTRFHSSTFFIKEQDHLVGLLCINEDLTHFQNVFDAVSSILGKTQQQEAHVVSERLVPTIDSLPVNVIDELIQKRIHNINHLTKEERIDVVKELDKKGVFLIKGSINQVAKTLKVSEATMYRYLQAIK